MWTSHDVLFINLISNPAVSVGPADHNRWLDHQLFTSRENEAIPIQDQKMDWWNQRRCQNKAGIDSAAAASQHRCVWVSCSLRHRLIWAGRRQTNNGTATPRVLFKYASPFQCHFLIQRQYKQNPRAKTHLTSSDPLDGSSPADLLKKKHDQPQNEPMRHSFPLFLYMIVTYLMKYKKLHLTASHKIACSSFLHQRVIVGQN